MTQQMYGPMSASDLRRVMLTMIRAAMAEITSSRGHTVVRKTNYAGEADADLATSVDFAAQTAMESVRLAEAPWAGVIGEEEGLIIPCQMNATGGVKATFTYDGLDGTKHYNSGARDGVGSLLSFVYDDQIPAVCVGDVFGRRIYLLDPLNGRVVLLDEDSPHSWPLDLSDLRRAVPLGAGAVLWRGDPGEYHPLVRRLLFESSAFPTKTQRTGSLGLTMAELWCDTVTLHVQSGSYWTPWDDMPLIGINRALGMTYVRPADDGMTLEEFVPAHIMGEPVARPSNVLVLHRSRLSELAALVPLRILS